MLELAKALKSCGVLAHASGPDKQPPLRLDTKDTLRIREALGPILALVGVCERVTAYAESMNWMSVSRPLREAVERAKGGNGDG